MIMSERAQFDLARRLRSDEPPTLGEVFTFLSGLYFRGKIAYANAFVPLRRRRSSVLVITPTRGLVPAVTPVGLDVLAQIRRPRVPRRAKNAIDPGGLSKFPRQGMLAAAASHDQNFHGNAASPGIWF